MFSEILTVYCENSINRQLMLIVPNLTKSRMLGAGGTFRNNHCALRG